MGSSFYIFTGIISIVIGILLGFLAFTFFRRFKKFNDLMKNESELSAVANGSISEVKEVRRSNRSFRWVNEYPVITYTVDGKLYNVTLDYAEKRRGYYSLGGNYRVHYKSSDPSCCLVEEFRKQMKSYRTQAIVVTVFFAFFAFNLIVSGTTYIINTLTGAIS